MKLDFWLFKTKMSKTDFAESLGISRGHLSEIISGKRRPSPDLSKKIEQATGGQVTIMELLFPEDYKEGRE